MKTFRRVVSIEVIFKAEDDVAAASKFENINLGLLETEQKMGFINCWSFRDADSLQTQNEKGDWE